MRPDHLVVDEAMLMGEAAYAWGDFLTINDDFSSAPAG